MVVMGSLSGSSSDAVKVISASAMDSSAPVTVAAAPLTVAVPDRAAFSIPSAALSAGAVMLMIAVPLALPAGMVTVNMSPVWSVVKSPGEPKTAP